MGVAMPRARRSERSRTSLVGSEHVTCRPPPSLDLSLSSRRTVATKDLHGTPESRASRSLEHLSEVLYAGAASLLFDCSLRNRSIRVVLDELAAGDRLGNERDQLGIAALRRGLVLTRNDQTYLMASTLSHSS